MVNMMRICFNLPFLNIPDVFKTTTCIYKPFTSL